MTRKAEPITAEDAGKLYRDISIKESDFISDRVFQVALASEYPVERPATKRHVELGIASKVGEPFWEVLSHEEGDYDLSRFAPEKRAAFLDEHVDKRQIGYFHRAQVSKDKVTRAIVEFDLVSKLSKTRHRQMRNGSRPHMSNGYRHTKYLGSEKHEDGRTLHRFAWEGLEGSSVAVPADPTVGLNRAGGKVACFDCGEQHDRAEMIEGTEGEMLCPDCSEAEAPADERTVNDRFFRRKKKDGEELISHNELRTGLHGALNQDNRFKSKDGDGNTRSDYQVHDIHQIRNDDGEDDWQAIVQTPAWRSNSKYLRVGFTYEAGQVKLGESAEVEPRTSWEAAERGLSSDLRFLRANLAKDFPDPTPEQRKLVDSEKLSRTGKPDQKIKPTTSMPKTLAELTAENPEAVAELRTTTERETRAKVKVEYTGEQTKLDEFNKEVRALANEFDTKYGARWYGKPGEVKVVGSFIRSLEAEICRQDMTHDAAERRQEFKRRAGEIIDQSREAKIQVDAAMAPEDIASRCSLRNIYNAAARSKEESPCYMPKEGPEREWHDEMNKRAAEYPSGLARLGKGLILPANMPCRLNRHANARHIRNMARSGRLTRDSLASDFSTAGALIQPEFPLPTIELLRNWVALSNAGMTVLGGVMGDLVLPRQTAATKSQSVAEGAALAEFDQTFDQIRMTPHRCGSNQAYSRLAMLQTTEDFEALVIADHMAQNALYIDEMGINGTGAGDQPLGILNQIGINSVTFGGSAANAFKNVVAMETAIRAANIRDDISYITTSTARGTLRSTAMLLIGATTVVAEPIWVNDEVNERPAFDSQQIPNNLMIAGAFRHLVMAMWGGWAVVLDTLTLAKNDKYQLSMNAYIDFALRHAQAITRSADAVTPLA